MLERQRRLDEAGDACRCLGMAYICLYRPDKTTRRSRGPSNGHGFYRITGRRPRTMGFDVGQAMGIHTARHGGRLNNGYLCALFRDGQSPGAPVLVNRGSVNDRVDGIAIPYRRRQEFQHDDPGAVAATISAGSLVEGPAAPVRRQHVRLLKTHCRLRGQQKVGATGECRGTGPGLDIPAGQVYGGQR